jgi:hypothetical protein
LEGHTLCGDLKYTPSYNDQPLGSDDPLTYDDSSREFTIVSTNASLSGTIVPYGVDVEFITWPKSIYSTVSTATNGANVEYDNPCNTITSFAATDQTDPAENYFQSEVKFTLTQFTIEPSQCKIVYTCKSVARVGVDQDPVIDCDDFTFDGDIDGTVTDGVLTFTPTLDDYSNGTYEPGEYIVTITGIPEKDSTATPEDATFKIVLIDPCASPTITVPELEDQLYRLTSASYQYVHPVFTVVPDFCDVSYDYSVTPLSSTSASGITAPNDTSRAFTIFYDQDDAPISPTI